MTVDAGTLYIYSMAYKLKDFAQGPSLDKKLEYLYLRRSVLDHLIRSLELYEAIYNETKSSLQSPAVENCDRRVRQLAS